MEEPVKRITVLIVDDSALMRKLFSGLLADVEDIEVVGTAHDVQDAREKIKRLNPDVLTLDIEMPGMDGLSFLEKIMTLRPMPVIMVSTLVQEGAMASIRALEIGAVDYLAKPTGSQNPLGFSQLKGALIEKIRIAAQSNVAHKTVRDGYPLKSGHPLKPLAFRPAGQRVIAIGSSTGGVEALRELFSTLPANCPPIVMAQHMPALFTPSFAARLDACSDVNVAEAYDGARLRAGQAWLAPGDRHLCIERHEGHFVCRLRDGDLVSGHRPSVDVLFDSVAENVGDKAVGIILTGMGKDGALGLLNMHRRGAYTIGQSQSSCVVYGMPRAAMAVGAVEVELPLHDIARNMLKQCEKVENGQYAQ